MRLLHVEDDVDWFNRSVLPELIKICSRVDHASDFASAEQKLNSTIYDYVVVDQSIPLNNQIGEADVSNGIRFADMVKTSFPGTPILILTGQSQEEVIEKYIEDQEPGIFWDGQPRGLIKSRSKSRLVNALALIEHAANELSLLEQIELNIVDNLQLDLYQKRVVRLFAKSNNAVAAMVKSLSGGLSNSTVLQITLMDHNHNNCQFALAKIDNIEAVEQDVFNFRNQINKLPVASFPNLLGKYQVGCGKKQGAFYQFASDYSIDYFEVLKNDELRALEVLKKIRSIFNSWEQARAPSSGTLRDIRQVLCSDNKFSLVRKLLPEYNYDELEKKLIRYNESVQHGDLHGKNILLPESGDNPIIIDYGDVKLAPSVLDVVTLELSPYFHPDMAGSFQRDREYFLDWFDEKKCVDNSPFPQVAKFLKEMKKERAFMNNCYVAVAYGYALRQLSYQDTSHEIALALIEASINYFENQ
ncbi:phosphotransferase [Vibrio vulnificus]|uniref:phosphotransferase n=1 Tax=Vibrio vulnificus TaxID=672 RepID=UPI0028538D5F|nr:response regulator transcription factor [Vibrio cholerae]HDV5442713.1 response regulator transcription factor [Vibrio cholerae]HDV5538387.1 response regulator transcription factor [Vibrio cholerae]HDV5557053.1 response regulator transcription factor [Vibrio cholerae]